MELRYKVVETSTVTDEDLERILNEWTGRGWVFEGFHFIVREASKRPSMAFVTFTRREDGSAAGATLPDPARKGSPK